MNDILFFPVVTTVKDELGQIEEIEKFSRQVFCEKKSVPQSEFFQAGQSGIKASCTLIIHLLDYQEEQKVKYREKEYSIYRTYERNDEKVELYCEVKAGG
ncbi:phage head closure protein [Bacillus pseudomycoides]|uniref:phage head closure protein n=1 Tax=Bacillus pseudomycoides TaxID=64104 RepID=UPI000BEBAFD0|nr:phage head closure protein [Bacillus pseudomycoides]PEE39389.1 phage head-tail adapter protein [Bacillus pseudomycoides]PGA90713.1 phage head-tail adapter protein [Bacillus pseudomycoides]PHF50647.1 phage head-tail adapter protein [Bacillus pseudomycoides]